MKQSRTILLNPVHFIWCAIAASVLLPAVCAKDEFSVYAFGKEPKISTSTTKDPLYRTKGCQMPALMVDAKKIFSKEYHNKSVSIDSDGDAYYKKSGNRLNGYRLYVINPHPKEFKNVVLRINHFIESRPSKTTSAGGTRMISESTSDKKTSELQTYQIASIPANGKIVIDTPPIKLFFSSTRFVDDPYDRAYGYDDSFSSKSGDKYQGCVITIMDGNTILVQITNNRSLQEFSID